MINDVLKNHSLKSVLKTLEWLLLFCSAVSFANPTTPSEDFIDNHDGTVTHKVTRLVWMRCAIGQTWDNASSNCIGQAKPYSYDQATALVSNMTGKNPWRLPTIAELHALIERENSSPRINSTLFPNTPTDEHFWSSTLVADDPDSVWVVGFSSGDDYWYSRDNGNYLRLVHHESTEKSPLSYSDFVVHTDGTVTQKLTGLMWQRCSVGQTWTGSSCFGDAVAYDYEQALRIKDHFAGYHDWRMPTINELLSIADYSIDNPAINSTLFPNTPIDKWFWSATPVIDEPIVDDDDHAWVVNFSYGYDYWSYKHYYYYIRLVRSI